MKHLLLVLLLCLLGCQTASPPSQPSEPLEFPLTRESLAQLFIQHAEKMPVPPVLVVPPGVEVGNSWEMVSISVAGTFTEAYSVVAKREDSLIVESSITFSDKSVLIRAWIVDTKILPFSNNVISAWVGLPKRAPKQILLKKDYQHPPPFHNGKEETIELGGRSWETIVSKFADFQKWVVKDSHFVIRLITPHTQIELDNWSDTGGKAQLVWK